MFLPQRSHKDATSHRKQWTLPVQLLSFPVRWGDEPLAPIYSTHAYCQGCWTLCLHEHLRYGVMAWLYDDGLERRFNGCYCPACCRELADYAGDDSIRTPLIAPIREGVLV